MFFKLLRGIALAIWKMIEVAAKLIYGTLKFLRIRLLALWLVLSGVLALFGVFQGRVWIFWVGVAVCLLVTLFGWGKAVKEAVNKKNLARTPAEPEEEKQEPAEGPEDKPKREKKARAKYPVYYDVEGREDYFFAEFEDRYELYRRVEGGSEYVRTDYKEEIK